MARSRNASEALAATVERAAANAELEPAETARILRLCAERFQEDADNA